MKRIALFFDRSYVDAHCCFTELAKHLSLSGYEIDLYCLLNSFNPPPTFYDSQIRVLSFPTAKFALIDFWRKVIFVNEFKYAAVFGTPFQGAFLGYKVSKYLKVPFIYLADEIFNMDSSRHSFPNYPKLKQQDKSVNSAALATIALGEERYRYQQKVNQLPTNHRYFVLPNAQPGASEQLRSNYFKDVFNINDNKPIVLFIGTLDWNLAKQLYEHAKTFVNKPYHLVFHARSLGKMGHAPHPFIKISSTPIPSGMLNYVVSSADIGLVLYDKDSTAEKENTLTAGKIGTYLKNNLPLIAGNVDDLKHLESKGVAVYLDNISELDHAVKKAIEQKEKMKKNIVSVYEQHYNYSRYFKSFETFLNGAL